MKISMSKKRFRNCGSQNDIRIILQILLVGWYLWQWQHFQCKWTILHCFDLLFISCLFFLVWNKNSVTLRLGFEMSDCIIFQYASCSDIISTETWITSSFDLSLVQISLSVNETVWLYYVMCALTTDFVQVVGYSECAIETAEKKERNSHWEWKERSSEISSPSVIRI